MVYSIFLSLMLADPSSLQEPHVTVVVGCPEYVAWLDTSKHLPKRMIFTVDKSDINKNVKPVEFWTKDLDGILLDPKEYGEYSPMLLRPSSVTKPELMYLAYHLSNVVPATDLLMDLSKQLSGHMQSIVAYSNLIVHVDLKWTDNNKIPSMVRYKLLYTDGSTGEEAEEVYEFLNISKSDGKPADISDFSVTNPILE